MRLGIVSRCVRAAGLLVVAAVAVAVGGPTAEARRVALVIGQNAYANRDATGLQPLSNPHNDALAVTTLLRRHGFEIVSCGGAQATCLDVSRAEMLSALDRLHERARGAETALVYFAGHGMATEEGNILAPVDARIDCATGAVREGVTVERLMAAVEPARNKLLVLDACRDNPIGDRCPALKGKQLSFTRIEPGAMNNLLLVTSTQFGQGALDGPLIPGANSPFAAAFLDALEANPNVYFEQVMNEVARGTYEAAMATAGFDQIPGKVVGGEAPADCLAGRNCIGDARMAALAGDNARLAKEATQARTEAERQAELARKTQEQARFQRTLLSPGPVAEIKMGSEDAPVLMVEYCAMWVPWCHVQHRTVIPELKRRYIDTGLVFYIYRDIPMSDPGIETHMLADCMSEADRSRYLMQLYERREGQQIGANDHRAAAQRAGMSEQAIAQCLANATLRADVRKLADRLPRVGVRAMPTYYINSEKVQGSWPLDVMVRKIDEQLAAAGAKP